MSRSLAFASLAAAGVLAGAVPAHGATVLSVTPNGLCAASGCFEHGRSFTQTFAAGSFSGPFSISALALDRRVLGAMQDYVVRISFRLADGTEVANWGGFLVAVLGGDVVTLRGPEFDWSALGGDLVVKLDLIVPGAGGVGGGFAPAMFGGGESFIANESLAEGSDPGDLASRLTAASLDKALAAPEPGAWALMLLGFGGAGAALRRRRKAGGAVVRAQPRR